MICVRVHHREDERRARLASRARARAPPSRRVCARNHGQERPEPRPGPARRARRGRRARRRSRGTAEGCRLEARKKTAIRADSNEVGSSLIRELDRIVPGGKHTGPVSHPERIVPDETEPGIVAIHLKRYALRRALVRGAEVLDVGCGVGYGSAVPRGVRGARSWAATSSEEAIEYARRRYAQPERRVPVLDATALPFQAAPFDAVCCVRDDRAPGRPARRSSARPRASSAPAGRFSSRRRAPTRTTHAPRQPLPPRRVSRAPTSSSCCAGRFDAGRAVRRSAACRRARTAPCSGSTCSASGGGSALAAARVGRSPARPPTGERRRSTTSSSTGEASTARRSSSPCARRPRRA